jgi:hypothetical protein
VVNPGKPMTNWWNLKHTTKTALRSIMMRQSIEALARGGRTHHSARGMTLPALIQGLEERGVPYEIRAYPGRGYVMEGKPHAQEK